MGFVAERLSAIKPSPTIAVSQQARDLEAAGHMGSTSRGAGVQPRARRCSGACRPHAPLAANQLRTQRDLPSGPAASTTRYRNATPADAEVVATR